MIQANELRIGNLLYKDGIIVTIDARSIFDIWDKSDKYSPIPLTPEILEKAGFVEATSKHELAPHKWVFEKESIICVIQSKMYFAGSPEPDQPHLYFFTIKGMQGDTFFKKEYVHQLQNLYFALTSTELPLEL